MSFVQKESSNCWIMENNKKQQKIKRNIYKLKEQLKDFFLKQSEIWMIMLESCREIRELREKWRKMGKGTTCHREKNK